MSSFLATDEDFQHVEFGKVMLDSRGLSSFKRANPWLRELETLPFTVVYKDGERVSGFAGGGVTRLTNRRTRYLGAAEPATA